MKNMRKIISKNNKRLVFPQFDLSIEPDEIKIVTNEDAGILLGNIYIKEVLSDSLKPVEEDTLKIKKVEKSKKIIKNK